MIGELSPSVLSYLLEEATDAILIMDARCRIRYANPAMAKLCGYGLGELIGESLNGLLPDSVAPHHDNYVRDYVNDLRPATVLGRVRELELRHRTGEMIPIELKALDLGIEGGTRYFGAFMIDLRRRRDIEAKNAALMAQLEQQALTDVLTGLPNRRAFQLEATRIMARAKREGWPITVGIADIDWFKKVNDEYGHPVGDIVLRSVAQTIQSALRAGDLFGRIGGEEFAMLLPHVTSAQGAAIVDRMRALLANNAIAISSTASINISISIGLAELNVDHSLDTALAHADGALYQAKLTGRNRVVVASQ